MSNQILWDCHMHSSFSADSDTSMEDMIREAICRGLTGICFTEHLDPDYPPTPDNEIFELDLDGYRETLFRLREKYQKELQIHFGIELGLQPHLHDYFHELLATMPFDFVIGSSHVVRCRWVIRIQMLCKTDAGETPADCFADHIFHRCV